MTHVQPLRTKHFALPAPPVLAAPAAAPLVEDPAVTFLYAFGLETDAATVAAFYKCVQKAALFRAAGGGGGPAPPAATTPPPTFLAYSRPLACQRCQTSDPGDFVHNEQEGELVCARCGAVAVDHIMFEGEAERTFNAEDGEKEDRSHCGKPSEFAHLMSDAHQLGTMIMGGSQEVARARASRLRTDDTLRASTTTRCKDRDKHQAAVAMENVAARLGVCRYAYADALEVFARLRDSRERLVHKHVLMAACLHMCQVAQARRVLVPPPAACEDGPFVCTPCGRGCPSPTARIRHWDASPSCRKAVRVHKRSRACVDTMGSMDMLFGVQE